MYLNQKHFLLIASHAYHTSPAVVSQNSSTYSKYLLSTSSTINTRLVALVKPNEPKWRSMQKK